MFAYDRLGLNDVSPVDPNELANLCAAMDVQIRTASAVSSAQVAAQYDSERSPAPVYTVGEHVLVYFPDRPNKTHTYYRGPFIVLSPADSDGNYYNVRDAIQHNVYKVHVERLKHFDMSRTSLVEQAQRQLPSGDFGIVVACDSHRMNEAHGLYEFCIRFYSGYRAWQLYTSVHQLDTVKAYIALHNLNTRQRTPLQQTARLTGQHPPTQRPLPRRAVAAPATRTTTTPSVPAPAAHASAPAPMWSAVPTPLAPVPRPDTSLVPPVSPASPSKTPAPTTTSPVTSSDLAAASGYIPPRRSSRLITHR